MTRLLDDPDECRRRAALLASPHASGLAAYALALRQATGHAVPDVDPMDGGAAAPMLLLLETPGARVRASGFVSRDNPTPTARNLRRFACEAGLGRRSTVIWNVVPWVIHTPDTRNRAPRPDELRAGLSHLPGFLALLPALSVVVLAGRSARRARETVERACPHGAIIEVPHPSPVIVCTDPAIGRRIVAGLSEAAALIAACEPGS